MNENLYRGWLGYEEGSFLFLGLVVGVGYMLILRIRVCIG